MLQIDWMFAEIKGKKNAGFADFVALLSKAPHESVFSTELIKILIDHFWVRYYRYVIFCGFLPYLAYMIMTLIYLSNYTVQEKDHDYWEWSEESSMRFVILLMIFYFLYFEVMSMKRDRYYYFLDIFNYVDLVSFIMNTYLIGGMKVSKKSDELEERQEDRIRNLASVAALLMWFKAFYWLRLFGPTSFFVRMIIETIYDIRYFMILFIFILMTFGNSLLILSENREEELFKLNFDNNYLNVLLN